MRFHSQNLSDGKKPLWREGRCWWGRWHAEWACLKWHRWFSIGLQKGGYDSNRITFSVAVPWFHLYIGREFSRCFADREFTVYWYEGCLWLKLWIDDHWIRDRPWHRNPICLHVWEWIVGRHRCEIVEGDERINVLVPMPEGAYRGTIREQRFIRSYRFGITKAQVSYWLEIERGGLPFSGKGENSWDCGDDGLCGIGGDTPEQAIGNAVASALKSRRRYGDSSETRGRDAVMARPNGRWPHESE